MGCPMCLGGPGYRHRPFARNFRDPPGSASMYVGSPGVHALKGYLPYLYAMPRARVVSWALCQH